MKFLKPNKTHLLYIYDKLDHILHTWVNVDVIKKTGKGTTSQEEDAQNDYQMYPFSLPREH